MTEEIMSLCRAMGVSAEREELLLPLIRAVCELLAARLKAGIAPEDCGPAFPLAVAMIAIDRLSGMTGGGGEVTSFTAGELTIRKEAGSSGQNRTLSVQAEELLAPWLRNTGFLFQEVEG